jgi:hypothetical protein
MRLPGWAAWIVGMGLLSFLVNAGLALHGVDGWEEKLQRWGRFDLGTALAGLSIIAYDWLKAHWH